jgi:hypothetical protein
MKKVNIKMNKQLRKIGKAIGHHKIESRPLNHSIFEFQNKPGCFNQSIPFFALPSISNFDLVMSLKSVLQEVEKGVIRFIKKELFRINRSVKFDELQLPSDTIGWKFDFEAIFLRTGTNPLFICRLKGRAYIRPVTFYVRNGGLSHMALIHLLEKLRGLK